MYCNMILIDIYYYTVLCCHTCIILYCTATNMYLNICIIVPNDLSGNRVASVIDITIFTRQIAATYWPGQPNNPSGNRVASVIRFSVCSLSVLCSLFSVCYIFSNSTAV